MRSEGVPMAKLVTTREGRTSLLLPGFSPSTPPSSSNLITVQISDEEKSGELAWNPWGILRYLTLAFFFLKVALEWVYGIRK